MERQNVHCNTHPVSHFTENKDSFVLANYTIWSPYNWRVFSLKGVGFHEKSGIEIEYMKLGKLCVYQPRTTVPCTKLRLYANTYTGITWAERRGTNS